MSNTVDTRVVEMQFNNQDFEKNVNTSLGTLEKLKSALNFGKSSQQLTQLQNATNAVDFSPFTSALDSVQSRFSALGIVGATVINNLTNTAISKAKQILTAVPRQISQGGLSRALNIEQAKFQLKGLGIEWKDIEADINYGVKDTAYGLDAAAKAASQLTASGVKLGTEMQEALRGISGVAAMTNSSYEEISPIFTTVAGQGRLMTMQLRQLEARGLNVAAQLGKSMGKTEEEIRDMVTKGKIDFKTFSHYMNEAFGDHAKKANETYTGSLSNVKAALSRIGAEVKASRLENLRRIFVALIPVINSIKAGLMGAIGVINSLSSAFTEKIVNILRYFQSPAGTKWIEIVGKGLEVIIKDFSIMVRPIKTAYNAIFGVGNELETRFRAVRGYAAITQESISKFIDKLDIRGKALKGIKDLENLFKGLFTVIKNIKIIFVAIFDVMKPLAGVFAKLGGYIVSLFGKFGILLQKTDGFGFAIADLIYKLSYKSFPVFEKLEDILNKVKESVEKAFAPAVDWLDKFTGSVKKLNKPLERIKNLFESIKPVVASVGKYLGETLSGLWTNLVAPFKNNNTNFLLSFVSALEVALTTLISSKILGIMGQLLSRFRFGFVGLVDELRESLVSYQKSLKPGIIQKIAKAVLTLAAAMFILSLIDKDKLAGVTIAMTEMMYALMGAFGLFQAFTKNSTINIKSAMNLFGNASVIVSMAGAMLLLAGAAKVLASIDTDQLKNGLIALTVIMAELVAFLKFAKLDGKVGKNTAVSLAAIGVSVYILASAVKKLSEIDSDSLMQGLGSLAAILGTLGIFTNIVNPKKIISTGIAMNLIAISLLTFAKSLTALGEIPIKTLEVGLIAMAGALGILAVAMNLMPKKGSIGNGIEIAIISASLLILAKALEMFGSIPLDTIKVGLIGIGGSLAIIAVSMLLMKKALPGAAALLVVSAALTVLAKVIKTFTNIDPNKVTVALVELGAALTIVVLAGMGAKAAAAGLLALGASIALIGVGMLGIGTGLLAFNTGLSLLIGTGAAGIAFLSNALLAIINMIPIFMAQLGYGIIALLGVLADSYDAFVDFGVTILKATIDGFNQMVPTLMDTLGVLLDAGLTVLAEWTPKIINAGITIVLEFLRGVEDATPELVDRAFTLMITFINSLTASIDAHAYELWGALKRLFLTALTKVGVIITGEAFKIFIKGRELGEKFRLGVAELKDKIKDWFRQKIQDLINWFSKKKEDFKEAGANLVRGFIKGLENVPIIGSVVKIGRTAVSALRGSLDEHSPSKKSKKAGKDFVAGFCVALNEGRATVQRSVKGLVSSFIIDGKKIQFYDTALKNIQAQTKAFVDKSVANITWGKSTINSYLSSFTSATKQANGSYNTGTTAYKNASKAVGKFSEMLYLNSQAYAESNQNVQKYNQDIKSSETKLKTLETQLKKAQKSKKKKDKARAKELKKQIANEKKTLQQLGVSLNAELKKIANGAKEAYQAFRESIRESLVSSVSILKAPVKNFVNLFQEFDQVDEMPVTDLLNIMRSQIIGISQWRSDLTALGKRGIAKGLLNQLKEMGPEAEQYIKAFLKMTDEELKQANLMYQAQNEITSQSLIDSMKDQMNAIDQWAANLEKLAKRGINYELLDELQSSGPDNAEYVEALANMTAAQIREVNSLYNKTKSLPSSLADRILASLSLSNQNKGDISGIKDTASALSQVLSSPEFTSSAEEAGSALTTAMSIGIKASEPELIEASKLVSNSSLNEFTKYLSTENGSAIAVNMVDGLVIGLKSGKDAISEISKELAETTYNSAAEELDIHSPSRKFMELGKNSDIGFANGLLKYADNIHDASEEIASRALTSMRSSMAKISDLLNSEQNRPVIRPVLDLSEVSNDARMINGMFEEQSIGSIADSSSELQNGKIFNFTQNNYSPKALSRIEIYRQTKNLISTTKGAVLTNG